MNQLKELLLQEPRAIFEFRSVWVFSANEIKSRQILGRLPHMFPQNETAQ